ncbi:MAG: hypothetical protein EP330_24495 [Deltaproteobacteria bacterium]|nr:MAG: hypothetical protein EP330_24495 [Deltaproteobacteria bacterium]
MSALGRPSPPHPGSGGRLADALAIDQIALAEVRLLREAKLGNATALRALLEPHLDRLWSISSAMFKETDALVAIGSFQEKLRHEVTNFALDQAFAVQLYGCLWRHLAHRTGASAPMRPGTPTITEVDVSDAHAVLQALEPFPRLVFTFQLITGLPVARLSELTGVDPRILRSERAHVLLTLHRALSR